MKKIAHCRACGSKALTPAFTLSGLRAAGGRRGGDIEFVYCDPARDARACGLLQSADAEPYDGPNPEYSGKYASNRNQLRQAATEALELISGRDCAALDIGCNDGALLSFYPRWVERYGVDPAQAVEEIGDWAWSARAQFPSAEIDRAFGGKKFDIVTAISVLETLAEPRAFLARVKALLSADGVVVVETLYAPMTLARTSIEAVAGAAQSVYSLGVLERLFRDCGLKIFRGMMTEKSGGSIRLFATHADVDAYDFDPWFDRLARLWDEENALSLRSRQPYQAFERRADEATAAFRALLKKIRIEGGTAHLAGCGPEARAVLALAGPESKVFSGVIADLRDDASAFRLPAVTETDSRAAEPEYLAAPASLKREMLERWRETILLGGKLVFATPAPHVVDNRNYAAELARALAAGDGTGGVETLRAILGASGAPRLVSHTPAAKSA